MSFAIEVPGDANPLNLQELCRVLEWAQSNDGTQRQAATQQLQSWELQAGFYSGLQSIFYDKSIPQQIRLLAIIQFKNGMDRYWRFGSHIKTAISPQEKELIRSRLFEGIIEETDRGLILQASVAAAKIVRVDQGKDWPNALSSLVELVRNIEAVGPPAAAQLNSVLNLLLRCVKEMATARLLTTQQSLQGVSPEIVYICAEIYDQKKTTWLDWLKGIHGDKNEADLALMNSLLALRIIRRLAVTGYEDPAQDPTIQNFWNMSQTDIGQFLSLITFQPTMPDHHKDILCKHMLQLTKLHLGIAESHPHSFVKLPGSISLVQSYWDLVAKFTENFGESEGIRQMIAGQGDDAKAKEEGPVLERLALKGLLLLRTCVKIAFQPVTTFKFRKDEIREEQHKVMDLIKTELLTSSFVKEIVNTLVTRLFIFRQSDLGAWEEDQEEWEAQERSQGNAYEWEVRPCAEKLFLDLLLRFKDLLIPPLMQYFEGAMRPDASIPQKESIYTALGIAAQSLTGIFNFDDFIKGPLVQDSQKKELMAKVLRRRIAILLSQIIPLNIASDTRPFIYQIYRNFLMTSDPENDLVVRLTTGRELITVVDDIDFEVMAFMPFAADILTAVIDLSACVSIDETRLSLLESVRITVQRLEAHASIFGDYIMTALPAIWENTAEDEHMVKQAIISIFSALVMAIGPASQKYHPITIPLIREASRPGSDTNFHLVDEGLELWNSVLQQSQVPLAPGLVDLYDAALPLTEFESETAGFALTAVESYIMFAPEEILADRYRKKTLVTIASRLDCRNRERARVAVSCMEHLIQGALHVAGVDGIKAILSDMLEGKVLQKIMEGLYDAWEARKTTGPNRRVAKLSGMEESDYFAILARLLYGAPDIFLEALATFRDLPTVWNWLMDEWFAVRDGMDSSERRKLYALALGKMFPYPDPIKTLILSRLQEFLQLFNETLSDVRDGSETPNDCLVWTQLETEEWDTPKTIREKELQMEDPVHRHIAYAFFMECMTRLTENVGGAEALERDWLVNVDQDVVNMFKRLMP